MEKFWQQRRPTKDQAGVDIDLGRYESFSRELVSFSPATDLSDEEQQLTRDIVVLDHRSLHAFGPYSECRAEVKALLQNAVITAGFFLVGQPTPPGEERPPRNTHAAYGLYQQADEIFHRHLLSQNRLSYLAGVLLGILFLVLVALGARYLPTGLIKSLEKPEIVPALIFFAGLGSIVSVLLRLSNLDVVREISRPILWISGLGRPLVASSFALVIYFMLTSKLVSVSLNTTDPGAYFVVAFLCGFSERFAQDLLDRVQVRPGAHGSSVQTQDPSAPAASAAPSPVARARSVSKPARRAGRG